MKTVISVLSGALLLCACSDKAPYSLEPTGEHQTYSLLVQDNEAPDTETPGKIGALSVYQFCDGKFYKKQQLEPGPNGEISVAATNGSRLYLLSGIPFSLSGETIDEQNFCHISVGRDLHDNSAPEFMTAVVDLEGAATKAPGQVVALKRNVARVDLNTTADSEIKIREILIEDAPAEIYPFLENTPVSEATVSYRKEFSEGISGQHEAMFRIFESTRPVHVLVLGSYKDAPLRLRMELPTVERNKIYELEVRNAGSTVEGTVEIKPWDEGGTVVGAPDTGNRILLDAANSRIPEGVKADFQNNVIEVPITGVSGMTLAFRSDTRIDIDSIEGADQRVSLSSMSMSENQTDIISSFDVSVEAQGKGCLGYSVLVHLKSALMQSSYDYVEIRVAPSDHQIETVEMGGQTWMAFNARSRDLEDQIYPLDGMTVEDMYRENWINTVGGLFQFGRLYMYVPWQGYNPSNDVGQQGAANAPWVSDTHMPCPEGYRVPTRAELRAILPTNAQIPGSYTGGNGERITATLHTANGTLVTPTGVTGTQRYIKLVADGTDRYLILPLAGGKGDKSTSNNPSFGRRVVLWTNDRNGCPGGYAYTCWLPFEANDQTNVAENQLQMEAFASVRCVKK